MAAKRFPFVASSRSANPPIAFPFLPISLELKGQSVEAMGLIDSAASVNVLPFELGKQLGADWADQKTIIQLTGNLAEQEARAIILRMTVPGFAPVRMAFAWTQTSDVPVLLGQVNFFMEFDVCFFRSKSEFEVKPKE